MRINLDRAEDKKVKRITLTLLAIFLVNAWAGASRAMEFDKEDLLYDTLGAITPAVLRWEF